MVSFMLWMMVCIVLYIDACLFLLTHHYIIVMIPPPKASEALQNLTSTSQFDLFMKHAGNFASQLDYAPNVSGDILVVLSAVVVNNLLS